MVLYVHGVLRVEVDLGERGGNWVSVVWLLVLFWYRLVVQLVEYWFPKLGVGGLIFFWFVSYWVVRWLGLWGFVMLDVMKGLVSL